MARNKKNDAELKVAPVLTVLVLCGLFAALGVGFVWYKNQIDHLGAQIKDRELRLVELIRQNKMRRDQLSTLCSPISLEARVKKLNLGLGPPALSQVIRIVDVPEYEQPVPPPPKPDMQPVAANLAARKN